MLSLFDDQLVPIGCVGLLYQRGRFVKTLDVGLYRIWTAFMHQSLRLMPVSRQNLSLAAQEILTVDHVPIRVTLTVDFQIKDPVAAAHNVSDWHGQFYSDLQIALREIVAVLSFEQALDQKSTVGEHVKTAVALQVAAYGIDLQRVSVRDITMPASIREIMLKKVEAERSAQASLIKAREEVSAARARVNAARLMSENPTVMRLKELETLVELAKSPGSTIVFARQSDVSGLFAAKR